MHAFHFGLTNTSARFIMPKHSQQTLEVCIISIKCLNIRAELFNFEYNINTQEVSQINILVNNVTENKYLVFFIQHQIKLGQMCHTSLRRKHSITIQYHYVMINLHQCHHYFHHRDVSVKYIGYQWFR